MYTIKQAAIRAGVSVPLLRAWERRYGVVQPERTPSGYRLYDDAAIERLRSMRLLIETGWSPSQAAREIEANGLPVASPGTPPAEDATPATAGGGDKTTTFVDAAAALDGQGVEAVLDDLFATASFERVVDDRIMPALRALGDAWADGTVSVAGEHAASHAVLRRISAAFEAAARLDVEHPVVVGLPPGSRHEIGALAFATAARRQGIGVVYLGADVPQESWSHAVEVTNARAVVIGIPTAQDRKPARDVVLRMTERPGLLVAVGGPGAEGSDLPESVLRLSDGIGTSAAELSDAMAAYQRQRDR